MNLLPVKLYYNTNLLKFIQFIYVQEQWWHTTDIGDQINNEMSDKFLELSGIAKF
jgi:hypothetical protein